MIEKKEKKKVVIKSKTFNNEGYIIMSKYIC